jgi:hypothetical protein
VCLLKTNQLTRLWEDLERAVEITNAGLDKYRQKIKAMEGQLKE